MADPLLTLPSPRNDEPAFGSSSSLAFRSGGRQSEGGVWRPVSDRGSEFHGRWPRSIGWSGRATTWSANEGLRPNLDIPAFPNAANPKCGQRFWEVFVLVHELMDPLSSDTEHLGYLCNAHRIARHQPSSLRNS
jgi:hypothetical protein